MRAPAWRLPLLSALVLALMAAALLLTVQPAPEASAQSAITYSFDSSFYNVREGDNLRAKIIFSDPIPNDLAMYTRRLAGNADNNDFPLRVDFTVPAGATEYDLQIFVNQDNVIEPRENFALGLYLRNTPDPRFSRGTPWAPGVAIFNVTVVPDDWALLPSGVYPGQQFRLLFQSDAIRAANSSVLNQYDKWIQDRVSGHGHTDIRAHASGFHVVGSTATQNAHKETGTTPYNTSGSIARYRPLTKWTTPVYWLGGSKIAGTHNDFWDGRWDANSRSDVRAADGQAPDTYGGRSPWTGTRTGTGDNAGTASTNPLGANQVTYGARGSSNNPFDVGGPASGVSADPFYGISQIFQRGDLTRSQHVRRTFTGQQVSFSQGNYHVTEGDEAQIALHLRYPENKDVKVTLQTDNPSVGTLNGMRRRGTISGSTEPAEDADYANFPSSAIRQITIPAGHTSHEVKIQTHKDASDEVNGETFRITIDTANTDVPVSLGATGVTFVHISDMPRVVLTRDFIEVTEDSSCAESVESDGDVHTREGYNIKLDRSPGPGKFVSVEIWEPTDAKPTVGGFDRMATYTRIHGASRYGAPGRISIDNSRHPTQHNRPDPYRYLSTIHTFYETDWNRDKRVTVKVHCAAHGGTLPIYHFAFRHPFPPGYWGIQNPISGHFANGNGSGNRDTFDSDNSPANTSLKMAYVKVTDRHPPNPSLKNSNITGNLAVVPDPVLSSQYADLNSRSRLMETFSVEWLWKNDPTKLNDYDHATANFSGFRVRVRTEDHPDQNSYKPIGHILGKYKETGGWHESMYALGSVGGVQQAPRVYEFSVVPVDKRGDNVEQERVTICRDFKKHPNTIPYLDLNTRPNCPPATPPELRGQGSPQDNPGPGQGGIGGGVGMELPDPLGPPEAHTVSDITKNSMTVTWRDRESVGAYFIIWSDTSKPGEGNEALVFSNTYTITDLKADTEYSVVVYSSDYFPVSILARHRTLRSDGTARPTSATVPEVSVTAGSGVTEGGDASFTITASPAPTADLGVSVTVTQSGDYGATTGSQTVTIPTSGSYTLTVSTTGDTTDEADGSVTATVNTGTGYTVSSTAGAATVNVADDDPPPAQDQDPAPVCTPNFDDDAVTIEEVTAWRDKYDHKPDHVQRWNKVLAALGVEGTGETPMTVAESKANEQRFIPGLWNRVTRTLEALEECDNPAPTPEVSVAAGSGITEGGNAAFTITANPAPASALSVSVSVSQSGDFGVSTGSQTVTIPTSGSYTLTVATSDDSNDEADGSVTATVNTGNGYTVSSSNGAATVAVSDDDDPPPAPTPEVSVTAGNSVSEGSDASFTITANPAPSSALTVGVSVTQSGDFGVTTGKQTVTIPTSGSYTLTVSTTDDSRDEADGSVTATVNTGDGYTVSSGSGAATVTVSDDDVPEISIAAGGGITEGGNAAFTITANPAPHAALSVSVTVSQSGDYGATTGSQTVSIPTTGSYTLTVATSDDGVDEADGSVTATVNTGNGYTVSSSSGVATVNVSDDDDPPPAPTPEISIAAGSDITEGGDATFTVTANPAPTAALTVGVTVSQSGDYGATTGKQTVTIPTSGSYTLTVATSDDGVDEADGSVTVTVNTGDGYTVSSNSGAATVTVSDDDVPEISIAAGGGITEGGDASFTITANPAPHAALSVSVSVSQSGDYGVSSRTRTVTIPTSGSYTLLVATYDDSNDEADGSVTARVNTGDGYTVSTTANSATVAVSDNDDPPPAPSDEVSVSVNDASARENAGTLDFTVSLSKASDEEVRVQFTTALGTATMHEDYHDYHGWITFAPGETQQGVSVELVDDGEQEGDETVWVWLNFPTGGAVLGDRQGVGTIVDDD